MDMVIFGDSGPAPAAWREAYDLGRLLGGRGHRVINGGYGGTMEASARGCKEAGGRTLGITCRVWDNFRRPNPWLDAAEPQDSFYKRLWRLVEIGEMYFVLPGRSGTLAELALTLELINKKEMPCKKVIFLGDFWLPLLPLAGVAGKDWIVPVKSIKEIEALI